MDQLIDRVRELAEGYSDRLAEKGIACTVSKRYFETSVTARSRNPSSAFITHIDRWLDERREKKYLGQNNRYHGVVLRFSPIHEKNKKSADHKEYCYILSKIERAHRGLAPDETAYAAEKIIAKADSRIQKMLTLSKSKTADEICADGLWDAMRYTFSRKYGYKKKILGRDRGTLEFIVSMIMLLATLVILYSLGAITR